MSKVLFDYIVEKKHHALRVDNTCDHASEYKARGLSPEERMADRFTRLCKEEKSVIPFGKESTPSKSEPKPI